MSSGSAHLLGEVAEVQAGYLFRTRIEHDPKGNIPVIQLRDIDTRRLNWSTTARVSLNQKVNPAYFVQPGDVLCAARGNHYRALCLTGEPPPALVSSHLFILRARSQVVLPEFLAWYLNQSTAQTYLDTQAQGSSIRSLSRRVLAQLPVVVPALDLQQKVVQIQRLTDRETALTEQLLGKRRQLIDGLLSKTIQRG